MRYDEAKIDEAVLPVLYIDDPKNKSKSVVFTEEGSLSRASAERLFSSALHR